MKAVFSDLQDHSNPMDGTTIHNREELEALLDALRVRKPFVCQITGANGFMLKMGVGPNVGCVQYSPSDGDIPYLMAVNTQAVGEPEYVEFLLGDTATSIAQRFCFPLDTVKAIAVHFIETGEQIPTIPWEEV